MEIDEKAPGNKSQQHETRTTDNETGHDQSWNQYEVPLAPDDDAAVDEDMSDVAATNSVASEHPADRTDGRVDDPDVDPQLNESGDDEGKPRGVPASDPESGA